MKIFESLKKYIKSIIIIILLLIIQAICDLSLPTYTSNIINVGVQQGGVENAALEVIREEKLENLLLFTEESNKEFVLEQYKLLSKDELKESEYKKYQEKYPLLEQENLYILKNKDEQTKVSDILKLPLLLDYMFSNKENNYGLELSIPEGMDIYMLLSNMTEEQRKEFLNNIDEKIKDFPSMMIEQGAITYVKEEYKVIGLDEEKIQTNYIFKTGGIMLLIAFVSMLSTVFVGFFGSRVAAGFAKDTRSKVFKKVLSFSSKEMNEFGQASLITRSTNDIQQIQMLIVMFLRTVIYAPIIAIGAIFKVRSTNVSMTWIIALAVIVILSIVATLFLIALPKFNKVQKLIDKLNLVTREIITGIPVIRAFSNQKHEEERFDKASNDLKRTNLFVGRIMSGMMPLMMLVMNSVTLLIIWHGAKGIDAGSMQVGDMMAFIQYTMQIIMSFLMISMISIILPRAMISIKRINDVLVCEPSIKDPKKPKEFDLSKIGEVEFKNVSFRYPDAKEDVITDISFVAKKGETTAFIGSTGSGKSTLINLIPRLFDVTKGEILMDGVNIKHIEQKELHKRIGYVPQKGVLFSGTIESNIKYSNKELNDHEMVTAAKVAQAEEFIEAKKDKYKSMVAQGGTNVSGGQKQRLSIARAIAKNPEFYIFDDSFSALDFKTDATLRRALKEHTNDATVLIVAQRISTIMNAEQIIVLDKGKIVGKGTHKELLKKCEVYKEIASSQLSKEELENA